MAVTAKEGTFTGFAAGLDGLLAVGLLAVGLPAADPGLADAGLVDIGLVAYIDLVDAVFVAVLVEVRAPLAAVGRLVTADLADALTDEIFAFLGTGGSVSF